MNPIKTHAEWYEENGRLLAQHVLGWVFPLAQLRTMSAEADDDCCEVARILNKWVPLKRQNALIKGIQKHNAGLRKRQRRKRPIGN
jgi:hypothetical protein